MLVRLAFAGIRSRLLASLLTIAISATAVATIVLAWRCARRETTRGNGHSPRPTGHTFWPWSPQRPMRLPSPRFQV
jgi:hypothetical protein